MNHGKPIFGICLGHQWLAMAAGAKMRKMKYGHRSHNQPVLDLRTRRAYLTSQNHGYAVDVAGLRSEWEPWFVNLNDRSNEGIRHKYMPFCSVQFHPEAAAGPRDTRFMFEDFIRTAAEYRTMRSIN
jgi:carbamoyl-phosphate synthase small subunit